MAEYQGYVAPVGQAPSYAEALQKRMDRIQEQQRQNVELLMKVQQDKNELRAKQLERLYGFKTNGWGDMPVQMFNEQRQRVTEKLKSNAYTTLDDFYTDLNSLNSTHSFFTNHYDVTNPVMQETMKYAVNPGLYPDKTKRVLDTPETASQKFQLQRDLGIQGYTIGENGEITIDIDDPTGGTGREQVSLFDSPYAGNVVAYGPEIDWNFVAPEIVSLDYDNLANQAVNNGKTGNQFVSDMLPQVTTRVLEDPALTVSAQRLWMQQNGSAQVDEIKGKANEQYARLYAEAVLNSFKGQRKVYAPSGVSTGRASGTTKPEPILSVVGKQVQVEAPQRADERALNVIRRRGAPKETGYEYALPNIAESKAGVTQVNMSELVSQDLRDELEGDVMVTPRNIRFLENRMVIVNAATSDGKNIGDISVPYESTEANDIAAIIKEVYGPQYPIILWRNGEIARILGGAPQTQQNNIGTGATRKFN
jgi:hypothetical protein